MIQIQDTLLTSSQKSKNLYFKKLTNLNIEVYFEQNNRLFIYPHFEIYIFFLFCELKLSVCCMIVKLGKELKE